MTPICTSQVPMFTFWRLPKIYSQNLYHRGQLNHACCKARKLFVTTPPQVGKNSASGAITHSTSEENSHHHHCCCLLPKEFGIFYDRAQRFIVALALIKSARYTKAFQKSKQDFALFHATPLHLYKWFPLGLPLSHCHLSMMIFC